MLKDLTQRLNRAKELLQRARHAAMATVNEDGSPHNTPFRFLHDGQLTYIYWGSHPESRHSKNVLRTGEIFVVVYDAVEWGGLYIRAENGHLLDGAELDEGLKVHNQFRASEGKKPLEQSYYTGDSPQRMWSAKTVEFWVNDAKRDPEGHLIQDIRHKIAIEDLLDK